jgi:iron(III) transport system permease protein
VIFGVKSFRWTLSSWLISLALLAPVLVMLLDSLYASIFNDSSTLIHLWQTVLPDYIQNTLLLVLGVTLLATLLGVPAAALIACTNLPGKQLLRWMLLLPLAMPAYLVAYLYTDLLDYAGPVQKALRASFNWQTPSDYWFFDMRTLPGATLVLALVLYPYIYMLARTAFEQQDSNLFKASQTLGYNAWQSFVKIALPLARPAIATAAFLVMMETLADFATVHYFAVNTLTTAIYDTWLGYGDINAANSLASILTLIVFLVVVGEQRSRARQRHQTSRSDRQGNQLELSYWSKACALLFCWLLVIGGFLLPLGLLVFMAVKYSDASQIQQLLTPAYHSVEVALISATLGTLIAVILGLYRRLHANKHRAVPQYISGLGYAIPGTVMAMAILASFGPLDHGVNLIAQQLGFAAPGLIFSGSIFAIIFAYLVRFAAIANGTVESGMQQIPASLDFAPATLGVRTKGMIFSVHLPLLKSSTLLAWLLFFVEAMKELPAVLLLRPFNFETLATHIYQLISDEMLEQGALGALFIVLFGLLPVIWLNKEKD